MPIVGYVLEKAKTGRSSCKGCKEKIPKGALRVGTESDNGEYTMCSWRCANAACFKIPKKNYKKDLEAFIAGEFQNVDEEFVKEFRASFQKSAAEKEEHDNGLKRTFNEISDALANVGSSSDGGSSSSKKAKKSSGKKKGSSSSFSTTLSQADIERVAKEKGMSPKLVEAIALYGKMTTSDLKQILKWNYLVQSGKKEELVSRVIDGHVFGTIPRCPECHGGEDDPERSTTGRKSTTLTCIPSGKNDGQGKWTCKGYHNGHYRVTCNFVTDHLERGEVPWVRTVEQYEELLQNQAAKEKIENSKGMENVEFDTSNMDQRAVLDSLLEKARGIGIKLSSNDGDARIALAGIYNANDKNITDTLVAAKKELGTVEEEKKQAEKAAAACKCPENAKLAGIFLEASTHADGFKKAAYKKVAYAIQNLNFIFGSEGTATGKQLGSSKKHKVDGIGKSSGLKMDEYLQDGKIQRFIEEYGMSFDDDDDEDDTTTTNDNNNNNNNSAYDTYDGSGYGGSGYGDDAYGM